MKKFSALLTTFVFSIIQMVPAFAQNSQTLSVSDSVIVKGRANPRIVNEFLYEQFASKVPPRQLLDPEYSLAEKVTLQNGSQAYVIDRSVLFIPGSSYRKMSQTLVAREGGKTVSVPLDYSKPDDRKIEIYYSSVLPFDPTKPTVIYVEGGPGGTMHSSFETFKELAQASGTNIILFDARGIGLSSPELPSDYLGFTMWSSEAIARDMKAILDTLGVEKATAYGISYGTVPATIFGHLFPERTRSVMLEGVIGQDVSANRSSPRYAAMLNQRILPQLNTQERVYLENIFNLVYPMLSKVSYGIGAYSADLLTTYVKVRMKLDAQIALETGSVTKPTRASEKFFWGIVVKVFNGTLFSAINRQVSTQQIEALLKSDRFVDSVYDQTVNIIVQKSGQTAQGAGSEGSGTMSPLTSENVKAGSLPTLNKLDFDNVMFERVLALNLSDSNQSAILFNAKDGFQSVLDADLASAQSREYEKNDKIRVAVGETIFDAKNYPLQAPVYYFEGTGDPATEFRGAVYHYKNSPQNAAYFFSFKNAGHNPLIDLTSIKRVEGVTLFKTAVLGLAPTSEMINASRTNVFPVSYTDKVGNGVSTSGVVLKNRCENAFAQ